MLLNISNRPFFNPYFANDLSEQIALISRKPTYEVVPLRIALMTDSPLLPED